MCDVFVRSVCPCGMYMFINHIWVRKFGFKFFIFLLTLLNNTYLPELRGRLNKMMYVKCLEQCLHFKDSVNSNSGNFLIFVTNIQGN